jgi:Ca2+-binding RTX toxin-like protein
MAILVTVAQYRDARTANTPFPAGEDVILADTGDNISNSVSGLTPAEIADLRNFNVDSIDATDDVLVLSIPQFISLGPVTLTPSDVVIFQGSQADLEGGNEGDVATLAPANVDFIDSTDDALTYTFEEYSALGTVSFTAADTVTITATAAQVQGLSPADIATMSAKNVDVLDPDAAITLTAAQAAAFAGSGISFPAADDVTVSDTGANIAILTDVQITALIAKGVDAFDASDNSVTVSLAQFNALGAALADNDAVTIADTGQNIRNLSAAQIAALAGQGVVAIDATDNVLTLTLDQLNSLGAVQLTQADVVSASVSTADLLSRTSAELDALVSQRVDLLDSTDDVVTLSVAQAQLITDKGLAFAAADTVTVSDSGAALALLSAAQISNLAAKGVDVIDATDNALTLTAAQAAALAGGGSSIAAGDTVTVADTGAALSGLTPAQLAALNGKGIDALNASDNVLALSVAQLKALGSIGLAADDAVRLTDVGTTLSGLSAGEIAGLTARGVDILDATNNALTLSLAQYQSLGALQVSAEDRVTINGTSASERIDGRANNEYLKGFSGNDRLNGNDGNDWLSGGAGKDVLTGGRGADGFVFDAKLSKKTNYDTVKDFNVRDDSVYLDNAIFKKLGSGSEANPGKLKKAYFQVGTKADDRNDYLIYNKKTGVLYYDADGSGSANQVEIAKLSKNLKLTEKDFFII